MDNTSRGECPCGAPSRGSPFRGSPTRDSAWSASRGSSMRRSPGAVQFASGTGSIGYTSGSTVNSADLLRQSPRTARSLDQYGIRAPQMPPRSTPMQSYNLPDEHETFGSQIDYNLSWMPRDAQLSDAPCSPSRYLPRDPNVGFTATSTIDTKYLEQSKAPISPRKRSPKQETLLEWFDRTVEKELKKRREGSLNVGENLVNLESPSHVKVSLPTRSSNPLILEASTSGIEIPAKLRKEQDTDLLDAVDKLAKAEAMIAFEGAVRAAEEAAAAAPPEFAEEAAAAGAQGFQAELVDIVKHEFSGVKPIEVVGYVGITRPKNPKKSNFI